MKTKIKENKESKQFPKLMRLKGSDTIVLMSHPKVGVVVNEGKHHMVGSYFQYWDMDCFEDFNGSITLSNE